MAEFESEHEVVLPADYREFLKTTNGGYPAEPGAVYGPRERQIEYFLPLLEGEGHVWEEADIESVILMQEGLCYTDCEYGVDLVPVAYLSGGDLVCLDCGKSPPEVVEWWHEVKPGEAHSFHRIAKTFTAFLKKLRKAPVEEESTANYREFLNEERLLNGVPVLVQYGPPKEWYRREFVKSERFDLPEPVWKLLETFNGFQGRGALAFDAPSGEERVQVMPAAVGTSERATGQPDLINAQGFGKENIWFNEAFVRFEAGSRRDKRDVDLFRLMRCESGNWVGIDVREDHYGEVVLIRVADCDIYKPAYDVLAPDFDSFLKMLHG